MSTKAHINRLDRRFDELVNSIKFKHVKSEFTPELRSKRRALADSDDFEFCKIYFSQIFSDSWNKMHRSIRDVKKGIHTRSGSRFFGKTAFTYVAKIIKPLCLGGSGLIGLGMRTQPVAAGKSEGIIRLIKENELLKYDYDIKFQRDKIGDYLINNKSFITFGFREGLRNFFDYKFMRFDVIILDDLFNAQSVGGEVDKKITTFVESECTGQLNDDGLLVWLFNYVSVESAGYKYAKEHPKNHFNLPALNEKRETNWPKSRWTTAKLRKKEKELAYDVWMGDWMNDPLLRGEEFDLDWLKTINIKTVTVLATISFVDPSHGSSPQACYKSIITLSYTDSKKYIIEDIYIRKDPYSTFFDYAYHLSRIFPKWKVLMFENDFAQWNVANPYFKMWKENKKSSIAIQMFNSKDLSTDTYGADKESRIRNLILPISTGEIILSDAVTGSKDYLLWKSQYVGFGKAKGKLDGLDATASGYILFQRYFATGTFKQLKARGSGKDGWLTGR